MKKLLTTLVSLCIVLAASAQQDAVSGRIMGSDSLRCGRVFPYPVVGAALPLGVPAFGLQGFDAGVVEG